MKPLTELLGERSDAAWEVDRWEQIEGAVRTHKRISAACLGIAALAVAGVVALAHLRQVVFVPIVVDKTTGETTVGQRLEEATVPAVDAMDKKCAGDFVRAREGYSWAFLKRDYDTVARMAAPEVFAPFNDLYYPKVGKGRQQAWGKSQEHVITVVSRRLTGPAVGGGRGMVVTYDKTSTYLDHSQPDGTTRHVATLIYQYQPKMLQKDEDRAENPFGCVITAYRSDPLQDAKGVAP
jgi:type IV secretion system protein VirB8